MSEADDVRRVMTNDHGFRVIAAETTRSARDVLAAQKAGGEVAAALAGLVTSVVLMRETMAPNLRVQGILKGVGGKGSLVGDSFPDGAVRGLVQVGKAGNSFRIGKGSLLQMMRTLVTGNIQQGIVDVGEAGGIGEALTAYFHGSEQVVCVARVGTVFEGDELIRAGGFVVQLLPEVDRPAHMIMTQRLEDFPNVDAFLEKDSFSSQVLIDELCHGMPFTELGRSVVFYDCRCSESTVLTALSSLSREDIQSMVDDGAQLEIGCDYCGKEYVIAAERLRSLLTAS